MLTPTLLLLLFSPLNLNAADDSLVKAAQQAQNGNVKSAEAYWSEIALNSPEFRVSFSEKQKLLYKEMRWDEFFGGATFYRKKLLLSFLDENTLSLEILALIKHCQFNSAKQLISFSLSLLQSLKQDKPDETLAPLKFKELKFRGSALSLQTELKLFEDRLRSIESILDLQTSMKKKVETKDLKNSPQIFSKTLLWKIKESSLDESFMNGPEKLRVFVKSECPTNAAPGQKEVTQQ